MTVNLVICILKNVITKIDYHGEMQYRERVAAIKVIEVIINELEKASNDQSKQPPVE